MNTATKLLTAMRNNPRDRDMAQLLSLATRYSLEVRNSGGSHHVFSHPRLSTVVTVPAHRPIKAIYVTQFLLLLEQAIVLMDEVATAITASVPVKKE